MKCRNCSKDIPTGFTDCPWCGEVHGGLQLKPQLSGPSAGLPATLPAALRGVLPVAAELPRSAGQQMFAWISSAVSVVLVIGAAYAVTSRKFGFVALQDSGYFIGVCVGPFLASAILVFAFYFFRRKQVHYSAKLLSISYGASFFALLTLLAAGHISPSVADPALAVPSGVPAPIRKLRPEHVATIWDPAMIALYADLKASNDAYVVEVSRLDMAEQTLYAPLSFRDASTIQQRLAELHTRLAIAEKYSSVAPLVAKMDGYVAAVNISDDEKRQFLARFMPGLQKSVAYRTAASGYERDWLNASIAAYQFMLANQSSYKVSADGKNGLFNRPELAKAFNQRLKTIYELKQRFLMANAAYLASQRAAREQVGMDP